MALQAKDDSITELIEQIFGCTMLAEATKKTFSLTYLDEGSRRRTITSSISGIRTFEHKGRHTIQIMSPSLTGYELWYSDGEWRISRKPRFHLRSLNALAWLMLRILQKRGILCSVRIT